MIFGTKDAEVAEEKSEEPTTESIALALGIEQEPEMRIVGLYGDIDEEKAQETLSGLLVLHNSGK